MDRNNKKTVLKTGIVMKLVAMSVLPVILLGIILTVSGQGNLRKGIKRKL